MFKYISDILSKFTQTQRVIALIILLSSIIIISIGPKVIELITYNNEELEIKVESQRKLISELSQNVNDLNETVIKNQKECTNKILQRENEILLIINEIENYVKKPKNTIVYKTNEIYEDTLYSGSLRTQSRETIIQPQKDEKLIKLIQKLKTNCKKDN
jgi:CRISPR/Cas system-associated endonuclease Cas3-HD